MKTKFGRSAAAENLPLLMSDSTSSSGMTRGDFIRRCVLATKGNLGRTPAIVRCAATPGYAPLVRPPAGQAGFFEKTLLPPAGLLNSQILMAAVRQSTYLVWGSGDLLLGADLCPRARFLLGATRAWDLRS